MFGAAHSPAAEYIRADVSFTHDINSGANVSFTFDGNSRTVYFRFRKRFRCGRGTACTRKF